MGYGGTEKVTGSWGNADNDEMNEELRYGGIEKVTGSWGNADNDGMSEELPWPSVRGGKSRALGAKAGVVRLVGYIGPVSGIGSNPESRNRVQQSGGEPLAL